MKVSLFYDYDSLKIYDPGNFNKQFKTILTDKIEILEKMPLPSEVVDSFLNGDYSTCKTTQELYLYRVYGRFKDSTGQTKGARANGSFATTEFAESLIDVKMRLALNPRWYSTKMYESKILIPIGTIINVGIVAPFYPKCGTCLTGEADQILLPENWSEDWVVGYRRVTTRQLQFAPHYKKIKFDDIDSLDTLYPTMCPFCGSTENFHLDEDKQFNYYGSKYHIYTVHYICQNCHCAW